MSLLPESYCYHVTFISHINCHFYHLVSGSTSHSLYSHASTFGRQNLAHHNNGDTNLHKVRKVTSFALTSLIIDNAQHLHICTRTRTHTQVQSSTCVPSMDRKSNYTSVTRRMCCTQSENQVSGMLSQYNDKPLPVLGSACTVQTSPEIWQPTEQHTQQNDQLW